MPGIRCCIIYFLTPQGLEEKARLTLKFLKRKISEYEEIKKQIKYLVREVEEERLVDISSKDTVQVLKRAP